MTAGSGLSFSDFRRRSMLGILLAVLLASIAVKYLNVLFTYFVLDDMSRLSDLSGLLLLKLATSVTWSDALGIGLVATVSVFAAVAATLFANRLRIRLWMTRLQGQGLLVRESRLYVALFMATAVLGIADVEAANTMAALHWAPLTVFALLNPTWGNRAVWTRVALAVGIALAAFVLTGSKTTLFSLVLAFAITAGYRGVSRIWLGIVVLGYALAYPYLNVYRGMASIASPEVALAVTILRLQDDFATSGLFGMLQTSFDAILNRLVGLDGVLVAGTLGDLDDTPGESVAYLLLGFDGVGISLSLMGQMVIFFGDLLPAMVAYPFVVALIWRFVITLDTQLAAMGFSSIGTYLYFKTLQVMVGGVRSVDMQVTGATIATVLAFGLIVMAMRRGRGGVQARTA